MNRVKKAICTAVALVLVCMMMAIPAFAAGEGSVWSNAVQNDGQTTVYIVTDTAVTDALVEVTYDADALSYQSVEVNEANVAMYAVNADQTGAVKISWVAAGEKAADDNQWLVKVTFTGEGDVTVSGAVNGGNQVAFAALDTSELEKAILEAEGLYQDNYTTRSWRTLEKALELARKVLADPTADQGQVDAAAETLRNGVASLELKIVTNNVELNKAILRAQGLREDQYTAESWAELEDALDNAKKVNKNRRATQQQIDEATEELLEAIDNLEVKPTEPEEPTEPEKPGGNIGQVTGKLLETIRKIIRSWFGRGN